MTDKQLSELMINIGLLKGVADECRDMQAKKLLNILIDRQEKILFTLKYNGK